MSKKIIDPTQSGRGIVTASNTPTQPKTTTDTHSVVFLGNSYVVVNSESGHQVARFDKFADALTEQARRNAIEQTRGII